jgi:NAD(P)-dependent dehydrogenase (short-subunit alcohol dehydrogenase family)
MKDFNGKVVVITGAGSGIGRALAQCLASEGARLALSDIDSVTLEQTLELLPDHVQARGYRLDVTSRAAVFAHAVDVHRDFGSVHMLVNNAGATIVGTIAHLSIEEIEWQLQVNLWSVIYGTKAFLPGMLAQREGCIVNVSSVFGLIAFPTQGAYNISKFGVRALTECLWRELDGTGVNAVCVHPGGIRTNVGKAARRAAAADEVEERMMGRAGEALLTPPQDMAAAIVKGLRRGRKRIIAGHGSRALSWLPRLFPDSYHAVLKHLGH